MQAKDRVTDHEAKWGPGVQDSGSGARERGGSTCGATSQRALPGEREGVGIPPSQGTLQGSLTLDGQIWVSERPCWLP